MLLAVLGTVLLIVGEGGGLASIHNSRLLMGHAVALVGALLYAAYFLALQQALRRGAFPRIMLASGLAATVTLVPLMLLSSAAFWPHGELIKNQEVVLRLKDSRTATGLLSGTLLEAYGQPCVLSVIVDITGRKAMEEALRLAKDSAETANRAKSRFLSTMPCCCPAREIWRPRRSLPPPRWSAPLPGKSPAGSAPPAARSGRGFTRM